MNTISTTPNLWQIKIDEARRNLSEETRQAIDAIPWKLVILALRAERGYSFSQLDDLEIETELLLCGLLDPEDYPKELAKRMNISRAQADALVSEMNEKVFKRIREELIKIIEKKKIPVKQEPEENQGRPSEPSRTVLDNTDNGLETREEMLAKIEKPETIKNYKLPASPLPVRPTSPELERGKQAGTGRQITNEEKEKPSAIMSTGEQRKTEEDKNKPHPILKQKLSGTVKIPVVETDHSLPSVTKDSSASGGKMNTPSVDPYREKPE